MKTCDLHSHSCYSDGEESPTEVVRKAKKAGIEYLALTDHNSVKGIEEAIKAGEKLGIKIIPGIEIRAKEGEVLGYFIDYKSKSLIKTTSKISKQVESKTEYFCKRLQEKGYSISFKELQTRFPNAKGNLNEFYPFYLFYLKKYASSLQDSFKIIRELKLKRKKIKEIPIEKAIKAITDAGGVPVLAHPWAEEDSINLLKEYRLKKLIKAGLKGLELDNGDMDKRRNPDIISRIKYLSKKYSLINTSGSDYHRYKGFSKNLHKLGSSNCHIQIVKNLLHLTQNLY